LKKQLTTFKTTTRLSGRQEREMKASQLAAIIITLLVIIEMHYLTFNDVLYSDTQHGAIAFIVIFEIVVALCCFLSGNDIEE
jgi:hypothetical protein